MQKVLSTKLDVDELDRFTAAAKRQGKSKAGLLRHLVQGYLNSVDKVDFGAPSLGQHPTTPPKQTISMEGAIDESGLPLAHRSTIRSLSTANINHPSDPLPSAKDSLTVDHSRSKGKPQAPPKPSISQGWLLLLVLLALWLRSPPSTAASRESVSTTPLPQADAYGLYAYRVGDTVVYSASPIPFW